MGVELDITEPSVGVSDDMDDGVRVGEVHEVFLNALGIRGHKNGRLRAKPNCVDWLVHGIGRRQQGAAGNAATLCGWTVSRHHWVSQQ